jgi:hypothetical protein
MAESIAHNSLAANKIWGTLAVTMKKPTGITISTLLMCLFLIIGVITTFTRTVPVPATGGPVSTAGMAGIIHGFAIVFTIFAAVCVYFYWTGKDWARWLVMIDCVLNFFSLTHLVKTWNFSHLSALVSIGQVILSIFLLWYLNTTPIRAWFAGPKESPLTAL